MPRRGASINPWLVAAAVVIPTFMEVLDTTIANVALRYIAGGLSAPATDSEWVITSYLAANAIILPISGWLAMRLGRRNYFLLSIAVFTLASALCGMATSLNAADRLPRAARIGRRRIAAFQPGHPARRVSAGKAGRGQTLFGIAALLAPVVGPTLGGYITDNYGWRWIFYLNVPVGTVRARRCASAWSSIREYLKADAREAAQAAAALRHARPVPAERDDGLLGNHAEQRAGMGLVRRSVLGACRRWPSLFVVGLVGLIYRELRIANPLINFRTLLRTGTFAPAASSFSARSACSMPTRRRLPGLLQSLFGYDATTSGLVLSPAGIFAIAMLFIVGVLLGRGVDARYLMAAGLLTLGVGNYWMSQMNLEISPWQVVWPRVVVIAGLSMIFAPLNVAAFLYIPQGTARRGGRLAGAAAQRRGQRRHVGGANHPRTPRAVPHLAAE